MRKITMALALVLMVFLVVMIGQKSKERSSKDRLEAKQASRVIKTNTTETKPASASVPQPVPPLPSWFEETPPPPPQTLTDKQMMALKSAPEKTWTSEELGFSPTLLKMSEEELDKSLVEFLKKKGLLNEDGSINKKASEKLFMADLPAPKQTFTSEEAGFAPIKKPTSKKAKIPSPSAKPKVSPPPSLLPGFILKQESNEEVLARGARDREETKKTWLKEHPGSMPWDGTQWQVDDYLGRMKRESNRIADELKAELAREQRDMKWKQDMQLEEMRLERNRLLREMENERFNRMLVEEFLIYRPRYWREPYTGETLPRLPLLPRIATGSSDVTPTVGYEDKRGRYLGQLGGNGFNPAFARNLFTINAPKLYDSQGRYRGKLSSNPYDPDSISNPYGRYGSRFSPDSINNPYGAGSRFSLDSPKNPFGVGWSIYVDDK